MQLNLAASLTFASSVGEKAIPIAIFLNEV